MRALQLLQDPDSSIQDVMLAIEFDPGLTSNVLRLANSAYFAAPRRIESLRDAVMRLGMNRIFQLVLTSAALPLVRQPIRGYDLCAGDLLEHSMAVALGVEELSREVNRPIPGYAFTAGLLHDVGKIILGTFIEVDPAPIHELAFKDNLPFDVAEERCLGINHAEAGALLLSTWNLPESLIEAVRHHHRPDNVIGDSLVADLVHVADVIALESGLGSGSDGLQYSTSSGAHDRLGLRNAAVEAVACRMTSNLEALRAAYGLDAEKE
jgi:putative nucleotidyltransferase with HDIG domain